MLASAHFGLIHSVIRYSSSRVKKAGSTPKEECMLSRHSKALAILTLSIAVAVGGLVLTRQVIAVAGEADAERLNRSILDYIAQKNPQAPIRAFQRFPEALVAEAQKSNLDHCLVLAQAEVESEFHHDAVGAAGRHPHYYRMVMGTYVEILERADLRCRFRETPKPSPALTTFLIRA